MTVAFFVAGRWIVGTEAAVPAVSTCASEQGCVSSQVPRRASVITEIPFDPTLHIAQLESVESEPYRGNGRNIFRMYVEREDKRILKEDPKPPAAPNQAVPTAIPLRFFGFATMKSSPRKVFLRKEDTLFIATEGQVIDGEYKIVRVRSDSINIEDLIEHRTDTLGISELAGQ